MHSQNQSTLQRSLHVLRRHRLLACLALVLCPVAAVLASLAQEAQYSDSAEVLLVRDNLAQSLTGTLDSNNVESDRLAQTEVELARSSVVAQRALKAARVPDVAPVDFIRDASDVTVKANTDLLEFEVVDANPGAASGLATEYARQYTVYRGELDSAELVGARREVVQRLEQLRASDQEKSALYTSLADKEQRLSTLETLQTSRAKLVKPADGAEQVAPRPLRNGLLGLFLGAVLALGLTFAREALDTRVRSSDEIGELLELTLLGRISEPPQQLQKSRQLVLAVDPTGAHSEAFRILRASVESANTSAGAKVIMVTSALPGEGKSTTVANLALALAHAGQDVVLVDLDLRRPILHDFFGLPGRPGLTEVALGRTPLDDALRRIIPRESDDWTPGLASETSNGRHDGEGILDLLPAGQLPPFPGEFLSVVLPILEEVRRRAGLVLIDAPPALSVADPIALSSSVDSIIVVARLDLVRRPTLRELKRRLDAMPARKLGFVLTGANREQQYDYDSYYDGRYRATAIEHAASRGSAGAPEAR